NRRAGRRECRSPANHPGADMKNGWPIKTLGDVCERVTVGHVGITSPYYRDEGILFLRTQNVGKAGLVLDDMKFVTPEFHSSLKKSEVKAGDVLMSRVITHTVHCALIPPELGPANCANVVLVRPAAGLLPEFLIYYIRSSEAQRHLLDRKVGSAQLVVNTKVVQTWPIPLPPLSEQRRIVGILDEAFEGLATAKANAEQNLQNARALFESHLQAVFTQCGDGWKMEKLDTLTDLARGHNPPKSKFSREKKPGYVRFYQIRDGGTDDYTVYVPDTPQLHKMKKDDIMMVAYRHVGRAFRGVEGAFNVALCKISNARRDLLDDDYLFHMIPSPFVKGELLKRSERSLIPSMSIEHLRELRIPLPPLIEQQNIVKLINSLSTETQRLESLYQRKLAALDELKKSLLHRAFSGQL
ncbi:MAG: restriction endonuclease subunit S, partial [Planctomycetaceae bacterium]|nr:restriction endonuclease subunit S [Planctomycetaceae bacterium]